MPYIRGRVEHVVHQSGAYFVASMTVLDTDSVLRDKVTKVSGHIAGVGSLRPGLTIHLVGEWEMHPKWGRQFKPAGWFPWAPSNRDCVRFLTEGLGLNFDLSEYLVDIFGVETFDVLSVPTKAHGALDPGDGRHGLLDIMLLGWRAARTMSELAMFLQEYDLGPETVKEIYDRFGHDVIEIISKNPYRLSAVEGFTFGRADRVASRIGIPRNDPRRVEGAVLWTLRTEARQGHLFVRRGELPGLINAMIAQDMLDPFGVGDLYGLVQEAVEHLAAEKIVTVDADVGVYLPELHMYEHHGAERLAKFLTPSKLSVDLDSFLSDYERANQIDLSEAQRDAVRKLVQHRVLILTGLPGTGKTTVVRTFVRLFKSAQVNFCLMAPTGIAAKRLAVVTGEEAMTIHRTFGYNGVGWANNSANKFNIGAVIVDEMSMVDQELFYRVLDALHPSTMLVLVGDDAQLPSVGPGNVLRELISCAAIPNVRLTQIFRQAETSDIVVASHKINNGQSPLSDKTDTDSEFQFIQFQNEERMLDFIVEAAAKLKSRDENFQVLSPKYEGTVGVNALNDRLRDRLNPEGVQGQWRAGSFSVREGDRLMVVKNDYELNIYNGDMGKLVAIGRDNLVVRIHGIGSGAVDSQISIPKSKAPNILKLAYAITVHKSQGSEFDTIVLPITKSQGRMLQRNLFYTAITRARKKVWLLGESAAVMRAVANDKVVQRNTIFGRAIQAALDALANGCKP
jgi:exodeoxyribonuclease V alpha subunit